MYFQLIRSVLLCMACLSKLYSITVVLIPQSPHVKESGFRNPGNFCIWNPESWKFLLVESGILGLGIRNPTNNPNPESKFH